MNSKTSNLSSKLASSKSNTSQKLTDRMDEVITRYRPDSESATRKVTFSSPQITQTKRSFQPSASKRKGSPSYLPARMEKPQPQFILKESKIILNPNARLNKRVRLKHKKSRAQSQLQNKLKLPSMPRQSEYYRLNRYIAQSGLCSRREADLLIKMGKVKVNDQICTNLSTKVLVGKDTVKVNGKIIKPEKLVYLLLNKPKNCITTLNDPEGRKTVMELVKDATPYRIFPVGRLDRNTTGILLLTNDGELAKKLTHPSHKVRKLYYVKLDKPLTPFDLEKIKKGVMLEDGLAKADKIDYVEGGKKNEIGIEIHSGRNRLVRRIFEHLGYRILALDRVAFGPIDKKGVPRGKWRFLTPLEIGLLKMAKY